MQQRVGKGCAAAWAVLLLCSGLWSACNDEQAPADGDSPQPTNGDDSQPTNGDDGQDNGQSDGLRACDIDSGFAGDELCIPEPNADDRYVRLHYGPADYTDQSDVDRFVLMPDEEETNCQARRTPNDEDLFIKGYYLTARPGTHHIIVYASEQGFSALPEGDIADSDNRPPDLSFLVGAQSGLGPDGLILDARAEAPEYEAWAQRLPAQTPICFETHYVNVTDEPLLRESWVRFNLADEDDVDVVVAPIFFIGGLGMAIPPHTEEEIIEASCTLEHDEPVRLVGLTAHMHAHGRRQTVWKRNLEGQRELIYETFDWEEPINALYDSTNTNPDIDTSARRDGAVSGPLWVQPGETIEWECEMYNSLDHPLRFGNGAYDAEMCNVFGFYGPAMDDGPWRCFNF